MGKFTKSLFQMAILRSPFFTMANSQFSPKLHALAAALCSRVRLSATSCSCSRRGVRALLHAHVRRRRRGTHQPGNPSLTAAEVSRLLALSNPCVTSAVAGTSGKLPAGLRTVLLDSRCSSRSCRSPTRTRRRWSWSGSLSVIPGGGAVLIIIHISNWQNGYGPCLFSSKKIYKFFSDFSSHRIFRRMHEVLNINENKN